MTKLIILRGPSGVGKSTVAQALLQRTTRPTVLVDLDHYRFSFVNPPHEDDDNEDLGLEFEMSASDILIGLRLGFDVIFDGNFTAEIPDLFLDKLLSAHPEETYLFYLDASLEERLKRHETKAHPRISKEKKEMHHADIE